jgi:predicted acetyltransferase
MISLAPAKPDEHPMVRRWYALYLEHLVAAGGDYQRDADGNWQPDHLPYWLDGGDDHHTLIIREARRPVGFAFVLTSDSPWIAAGHDFCLSELFVLADARHRGIGAAAARALFDRFPGRWVLSEVPGNLGAIAFWRRVLDAYTNGRYTDAVIDGCPTQTFDNRGPR